MKTLSLLSTRMYCAAAARRQKGATMIEYVLLAALIGVVVVVALGPLGTTIFEKFKGICNSIDAAVCTL